MKPRLGAPTISVVHRARLHKKGQALLKELGFVTEEPGSFEAPAGFPVDLPTPEGPLRLYAPVPVGPFSVGGGELLGVAYSDEIGYVRAAAGLAAQISALAIGTNLLEDSLATMTTHALRGEVATELIGHHRYYCFPFPDGGALAGVYVLVFDAREEASTLQKARVASLSSEALKKIGRALNQHTSLDTLPTAAIHLMKTALDVEGVMLWTCYNTPDGEYHLADQVGVNPAMIKAAKVLREDDLPIFGVHRTLVEESTTYIPDAERNPLTREFESRIAHEPIGGVAILPLKLPDQMIGVLEILGRADDEDFQAKVEIFDVVAEHLALALAAAHQFEEAQKLASHDPLTGIANHRAMQQELANRLAEAERDEKPLGILMMDVDHFRAFNEEEGHDAGDEVLRMVAATMKRIVRPYDMAARYGGEEFTMILPKASLELTLRVGERLREEVEKLVYQTASGHRRGVTCSVGAAVFPESATTPAELLKAADVALFAAKRGGRNRVMAYSPELEQLVEAGQNEQLEVFVESDLRAEARQRALILDGPIAFVDQHWQLSESQRRMVEQCILLSETYRRLRENQELRAWERTSELRSLLPTLDAIFTPFCTEDLKSDRLSIVARLSRSLISYAERVTASGEACGWALDPDVERVLQSYDQAA